MRTGLPTRNQAGDFENIINRLLRKKLKDARSLFAGISNFEDLKLKILMGNGDSRHTYRSYATAIKLFWEFQNGRILTARINEIEDWFDSLCESHKNGTAVLRIAGFNP